MTHGGSGSPEILSPRILAVIADGPAPADLTVIGLAQALPCWWARAGAEDRAPFALAAAIVPGVPKTRRRGQLRSHRAGSRAREFIRPVPKNRRRFLDCRPVEPPRRARMKPLVVVQAN